MELPHGDESDLLRLQHLLRPLMYAGYRPRPYWPPTDDYLNTLLSFGDELAAEIADETVVSKELVAVTVWIFAEIMRIAEKAENSETAREAAWKWFDKLNTAFGPITVTG